MDHDALAAAPHAALTLAASRDRETGRGLYPRVPATSPVAHRYEDTDLAGSATLYSYTVIHPNPKSGKPPFVLAYADFGAFARVFARLDAPRDEVRIGMKVVPVASTAEGAEFVLVPARET